MPHLLLLTGPLAGQKFDVRNELTLGRSPSCEVALEDGRVSRRHARLFERDGAMWAEDLGSRNGTQLNGQPLTAAMLLHAGDTLQVGETTALFDPPHTASLTDAPLPDLVRTPVEELLPRVGDTAAIFSLSAALLTAPSEAAVLRRMVDELSRAINADRAAAVPAEAEGLITAAISGSGLGSRAVEVPRVLARAALEAKEVCVADGKLVAPLSPAGGAPVGLLYAERASEAFTDAERALAALLGRLGGEALAEARRRRERSRDEVVHAGNSAAFHRLLEQVRRAAMTDQTVLFRGERGSGRISAAKLLHRLSPRALGPWVEVACSNESAQVEPELFGVSGALGMPPLAGALTRADGGTLVLRHVEALRGDLAQRLVDALLRGRAAVPQGGDEPISVRLVATSEVPLEVLREREGLTGLFPTGAELELEVPPLRERPGDVLPIFDEVAVRTARRTGRPVPRLRAEALQRLDGYRWPGNVRELALLAERLALVFPGEDITVLQLPDEIREGAPFPFEAMTLDKRIAALERDTIAEALRLAKGKKVRAAELLGISRPTLDKKIDDYALTVEKVKSK